MKNAIIMAGGKGTRMKSELPKVLHKILEVPMLEMVINTLKQAGTDRIVCIVGYKHEDVENALHGACEFSVQEPQLGTGHAVMQARQLENEDGITLVASGDAPCVKPETYKKMFDEIGDADMAILTTIPEDNGAYGRVIRNQDNTVKKIVEYKDANEQERAVKEINTGIYVFNNKALFAGLKLLNNDNAQHEYYLTDLVEIFIKQGKKVIAIQTDDSQEVQGINGNVQLAEASEYMQTRINREWMEKGVTIYDPKSTYIGPNVSFGTDVIIHPNTYLYGNTKIEDFVEIMPGTWLEDTTVSKGEIVGPFIRRKG